ncbi:MAG: hypothetical protein RR342_04520 [Bacilli bacterium]
MFKTIVYFDKERVAQYAALLKNEKNMQLKNVKIRDHKTIGGKVPVIHGEHEKYEEYAGEILENNLSDCDEFEKLLEKRMEGDYFDFTEQDYDFETLPRSSIIKFESSIEIPEGFDMMHIINDFRPQIIAAIAEIENKDIITSILGKKTTKIPINFIIKNEKNILGFSKINSNNLCVDIETIEEGEYDSAIVIAKFKSKKRVEGEEVVFDVMKDLFSMNRALRKQSGNAKIEGMENIIIAKDYFSLEILAIYE